MTIGYLMNVLKKASDFISKAKEGNTEFSKEEIRKMADIMSIMYDFIINMDVTE